MHTTKVPIAEAKSRFSEYVSRSAFGHEHIVLTRRGKPVAAIIGLDELSLLENLKRTEGLSAALDAWNGAIEVADKTEEAYGHRRTEDAGRDVSI